MKRKWLLAVFVLFAGGILVLFLFVPREALSYSAGAPSGYSSSPADARTCATPGCHIAIPELKQGWITSDVPPDGFLPGQTYTLNFTVTHPGVSYYGFQASPVDSFNKHAGTFSLLDPVNTQLGMGAYYITHTSAGNTGNGSRTWTAEWTAPSTYPLWPVTIYAAFIAGDSIPNDSLYHSRLRLLPKNMSIAEHSRTPCFDILPRQGNAIIKLQDQSPVILEIFDIQGRTIWVGASENGENIALPYSLKGVLFLRIKGQEYTCSQKHYF